VIVTSGEEKGKKGKVLKVLRKRNSVIVEGINVTRRRKKGFAMDKEDVVPDPNTGVKVSTPGFYRGHSPVNVRRLSLIDPKTGRPTKVGYRIIDGKKERVARKTGNIIPKPPPDINTDKRKRVGPKDTIASVALQKTFDPITLNPLKAISLQHKERHINPLDE